MKKILIANRGEIALRVIHACRELGIRTVAVYSTADRASLHVAMADESVCIGPGPARQSYLDPRPILSAANLSGAEAIHPGYGFLAEDPAFADLVGHNGFVWIGPRPETMRLLGDKSKARRTARAQGIPVLAGTEGSLEDAAAAVVAAEQVGYPVMLKARAGGGGRGMRVVEGEAELRGLFALASQEAERAFGDGSLYLEKFLREPRHIEFQVFGDRSGRVLDLGERECSIQRRHQKLLEEAPSAALTAQQRRRMGEAAVRLASAVGYENAGTVEFLLDGDGEFSFMEMNTRIQVEHPVTEVVTGFDLVKWQILVAAGEKLPARPPPQARGHAIECRINAEHPLSFLPSPGRLRKLRLPGGPGVRVDTHVYEGYVFPPEYDSLLAKLVAFGEDRNEAIARMSRALASFTVEGIDTTVTLHQRLMRNADYRAGKFSTQFMEGFLASCNEGPAPSPMLREATGR